MVKLFLTYFFLCILAVDAKAGEKSNFVKVAIRPECKEMFYGPPLLGNHPEKMPNEVPWDSSNAKPLTFKDSRTQITFYVETDGRHLAAINAEGKLLWVSNPFEDDKDQCEYRSPHPVIVSIHVVEKPDSFKFSEGGPKLDISHHFIMINFDSSQFGIVDEETGKYIWLGQN